jgi:hypothetical protein
MQRGQSGAAIACGAASLLVAALVWHYRRAQPLAYRLEDGALVIAGRGTERRFAGAVTRGEHVGLGVRLMGSGGLYGYTGWFRVGGARARAFVTDRRRTVVVAVGSERVAISPADTAGFLAGDAGA